jgi:N-formylglutamate amidohydrolase
MNLKLLLICLLSAYAVGAQTYSPGQTYWSPDGFIEYRCGNLPLIITAPHGGYHSPDSIPTRSCPGATTVQDANTLELAQAIDSIYNLHHPCRPHVVISHLHRRKLDPNRDSSEASCDHPQSMAIWRAFHHFAQAARDSVQQHFGKGLLLDLHGHAHTIQRIELGYQLTADHLRAGDSAINSSFRVQRSGIRSLVAINQAQLTHAELLRGENALGTWLQQGGYPSVPSQQDTAPQLGEPFFSGGYITDRHGSKHGGTVDAIQLEHYRIGIRDNAANRARYADTLRLLTNRFLATHYFGNTAFLTACGASPNSIAKKESRTSWFRLYPNPSSAFYVNTDASGELQIFDLQGKCHYKQALVTGKQLIAPSLAPGTYLLLLESPGQTSGWLRWMNLQ